MTDVAMLYSGEEPHPVHRGFAESVDADIIGVPQLTPSAVFRVALNRSKFLYPQYDVLITEGTGALEAGIANKLSNGTTLLFLAGGHGIHLLNAESDMDVNSATKSAVVNVFPEVIRSVLARCVDGVIAVSDLAAEITHRMVGAETPTRIVHPYIDAGLYDQLIETDPDLSVNEAVTVSQAHHYKGTDILVAAWGRVLDDVSDATLHIVGAGHPEAYGNKDGIEVHGYVENLTDVFRRCALYVQPSRIDTFPVSTLEAMATGLPTAVTNKTGTLSEVQKVDPSLIMAPNPSTVGQTISKYFRTSVSRRRTLSEQFRDIGSRFAETSQRQEFKRNFEEILEEIHSE